MKEIVEKSDFPVRKKTRLSAYDYRENGSYFVTICVFHKQPLLGRKRVVENQITAKTQSVGAGSTPARRQSIFLNLSKVRLF